jgi:hypothetical protein
MGVMPLPADFETVEDRSFVISNFCLQKKWRRHAPGENRLRDLWPARGRCSARHQPEWNGGWYYDKGGAKTALIELRVEMLKRSGIDAAPLAASPKSKQRSFTCCVGPTGCFRRRSLPGYAGPRGRWHKCPLFRDR